jgi:hypothetical protein
VVLKVYKDFKVSRVLKEFRVLKVLLEHQLLLFLQLLTLHHHHLILPYYLVGILSKFGIHHNLDMVLLRPAVENCGYIMDRIGIM